MEKITYIKSLKAKLILEKGFMLESYKSILNVFNKRENIMINKSFYKDRIYSGKNRIALIKAFRKNLVLYLAYNPNKVSTKIDFSDVSNTISYKNYPVKIIIENKKDLNNAISLIEKILNNLSLNNNIENNINYDEFDVNYSFDNLVLIGLIKKYIRYYNIEEDDIPNLFNYNNNVHVRFKVMVKNNINNDLHLFTNYDNWKENTNYKFNKIEDYYILDRDFEKGYDLEFKISSNPNWTGVEKGMFGEEIKNHKYHLENDIQIEDIIYNFRRY